MVRNLTERLARACARRPWWTVGGWLVVLVAAGVLFGLFSHTLKVADDFMNDPESKQATTLLSQRLPGSDLDNEVVIVRSPALKVGDPAFQAAVASLAQRIRSLGAANVAKVTAVSDFAGAGAGSGASAPGTGGPTTALAGAAAAAAKQAAAALVSTDGHTTIIPVTLNGTTGNVDDQTQALWNVVRAADGKDGFTVLMTGSGSWSREAHALASSDLKRGEIVGVPIALVILIFVFGSVVAALVPLGLGVVAIVVGAALTAVLGTQFEMSVFALNVVSMLGLALGIDYSLFIVSRFREERAAGRPIDDAIGRAAATASRAVLFSGGTVVLALGGMLLVPFSVFTSIASGAILVVIAAVAAALTLLPAVLKLLGDRVNALVLPGRHVGAKAGQRRRNGFWAKTADVIMRRPVFTLVVGAGVLLLLAAPGLSLQRGESGVTGLPQRLSTRQGYEILRRDFSAGLTSPILVAVDGDVSDTSVQQAIAKLKTEVTASGKYAVAGYETGPRGDLALLKLAVNSGGTDTRAADAVRALRDTYIPRAFPEGVQARVVVGGGPARFADMLDLIDRYQPIVIGVVLALSFVLILVAFRSVVIALKAVLMNLLSVLAAYGVLTLVFQHGVGRGLLGFTKVSAIEAWVPLLLFCFLFGLSMDYEVFLLSRIKERYDETGETRDAVRFGLSSTAGIITGAALIMVAVFAGLASGDMVHFQEIGLGLAVAVIMDATIVRVVVVPSTMALLGRWNWYLPRWLEWLPKVQLSEGTAAGGDGGALAAEGGAKAGAAEAPPAV